MSLEERKKKCPRCGAVITFYPAICRKDNKTEICSDCGVIEAIEEYINNKNKLEVGMYVRTKVGMIAKIIDKRDVSGSLHREEIVFILDNGNRLALHSQKVVKASHNIIDLIEVGDVITTNNLCGEVTKIDIENNKIWIACCDYETCRIEDVKSILTKEQFESMKYSLGEE